MRYAQIKSGLRLHIVCEAGEEYYDTIIRKGHLSPPLCRTKYFKGHFRMTINIPLANACKNCCRVWDAQKEDARI